MKNQLGNLNYINKMLERTAEKKEIDTVNVID